MMGLLLGLILGSAMVTACGVVISGWIEYGVKNDLVDTEYLKEDEDRPVESDEEDT